MIKEPLLRVCLIPAFTFKSRTSDLFYYGSELSLSVMVVCYLMPYDLNISHFL